MASATAHPSLTPRRGPAAAGADAARAAVRVVLRVRPFLSTELSSSLPPWCCVSLLDGQPGSSEATVRLKDDITSRSQSYRLDGFFGQGDNALKIFSEEVSRVIPGIFHGTNATVFAYGATGSGKTYTMQGTETEPGVVPLAVAAVLALAAEAGFSVEVAYYQIYLERCYDLLEQTEKEVTVLDDKEGHVQLKGLTWMSVRSMEEFAEIYSKGLQGRKVAHTHLNDVSSRSHAVLSIVVTNGTIKGKFNLIDMAGNEDNRRTCNEGIRIQESAKINQSLFALSNVIDALNKKKHWIPYRESKLTRILQDSLGGTSRALMIACINPVAYQESIYTVSLAARSRHVMSNVSSTNNATPRENVDMNVKLQAWLESKGKTKNAHRITGLLSPTQLRTPSTSRLLKMPGSVGSSVSLRTSHVETKKIMKKKLFVAESEGFQAVEKNSGTKESAEASSTAIIREDRETPAACEELAYASVNMCDASQESDILKPTNSSTSNTGTPSKYQNEATKFLLENSKCQEAQNFVRKALSPISSNKLNLPFFWEPNTPGVALVSHENPATPLDRFSAKSSSLKESFANSYLEFLNVASKEELTRLKGIGQKRAEYILELRQESPAPFKSLSDLEEIGLSEKQVNAMFRKAAGGIFM